MIQEFETRLAVVLGQALSAPFQDRVFVAGTEPNDNAALIKLGAIRHRPWLPEFATTKPERVPGQTDFRRVLRLEITVRLDIVAGQNQGRPQRRQGFDQLLFLSEQPDIADGSALALPDDQGFFIEDLKLGLAELPLAESADHASQIQFFAHGWFWPKDQAGQAGVAIHETHIRSVMDVQLLPKQPEIIAGGQPVNLMVQIGQTGFILEADQPPQSLGLDFLALDLRASGGGPGQGGLQGDAQGQNGLTLISVDNQGQASFTYTPPAEAGEEILHISIAEGGLPPAEKHAGKTLTKLSLNVGAP